MNELSIFNRFPTLFPVNFEKEFDQLLSGFEKMNKSSFAYPYDIYDKFYKGKKVATVIEVAAAGFKKEDCNVSIKDKQLTLRLGKPTTDSDNDTKVEEDGDFTRQYLYKRIANRTAVISWSLAPNTDASKISVKYKDGILVIEIPIIQPQEEDVKVIEIQ